MRILPEGLQAHLDTGATTLCYCWKLTAQSGEVMGFTDHDRDLVVAGVTYEAQAGFTASEMESALGLSVSNLEASGALSSTRLSETRLQAGDFDNAGIEVWLVNWQDVSQCLLVRAGNLGEVTHGSLGFTCELRGLAHELNQPQGRLFQFGCDAELGDSRCTVNLDQDAFRAAGAVNSGEENRRFVVSGLGSYVDGWFQRGRLRWTGGANAGRWAEIKRHRFDGTQATLELWQPAAYPVAAGDGFIAYAGCDKQFGTCRAKFANGTNFRGFPHIPGEDFVLSYARRDDPANNGNSRF
jgi:uncharacterized phage protein (TIGR02218 family)